MDFRMTDEQKLMIENLEEFGKQYFKEEDIKKWYEDRAFPEEVCKAYVDAGFGKMGIPEHFGGVPCDMQTLMLLAAETTRVAGASVPMVGNILMMYDITKMGTPEQAQRCVDGYLKNGVPIFALAISEPSGGSDNAGMQLTAHHENGKVYLNGTKTFVTSGDTCPNLLVVAKEEDPARENKNISMYMIPNHCPGLTVTKLKKIGQQATTFCTINFDNVECSDDDVIGIKNKGFLQLMKNFEVERMLIAAQSLGLAEAALEDAAKYAGKRKAFGQEIFKYQQIQQMLTDMEIKVINMRNMLNMCAWQFDNGESIRLTSALAKRYVCMTATEVCSDAMQIMGGLGYTSETRVSRLWADSRGWQFGGGTNQIMVHIAGSQIVQKYSKK